MKIAVIAARYPCVSETFVRDHVEGLRKRGHDVTVMALHGNDTTDGVCLLCPPRNKLKRLTHGINWCLAHRSTHGPAISHCLSTRRYGLRAIAMLPLFRLIGLSDNGPFDVVHCHFADVARDISPLLAFVDHRVFAVTCHGHDVTSTEQVQIGLGQETIDRARLFLSHGGPMDKRLHDLGVPAGKVRRLRYGIDLKRFQCRNRTRKPGEPVQILTVARLVEKKGIRYVLEALAEVGTEMDWRYTVIGDGPLSDQLAELAKKLGLAERVNFAGALENDRVREMYDHTDLFVLASVTAASGDQEGAPVSLSEAQACGLPVVATLHSGIPEIVRDGVSGFLVPERDKDALADRIRHLLQHPDEWNAMGRAGRETAEELNDLDKLTAQLADYYAQALAGDN